MSWYYTKNGSQVGPVSEEELAGKVRGGEVFPTELIWKEGMSDWLPFSEVSDFHGVKSSSPVAVPMPGGELAVSQSTYSAAPHSGAPIPNYLWQSIVVTVLCCMPFGIVSIVYAAKVNSLKASGNIAGAQAASKSAKTWMLVALGVGLAVNLIVFGVSFGSAFNEASS